MPNPLVQKLRASAPARRDKSTVRVKWLGDTPWANESQVTIRMFVRFQLFVHDLKSFDLTKDLPLLQFFYIYFPEKSSMTMHIYLTKNTTGSIYFQWMKLGWHCDLRWASFTWSDIKDFPSYGKTESNQIRLKWERFFHHFCRKSHENDSTPVF